MRVGFKGFRGFSDLSNSIELKNITILTGKNSSGKSSFIKLINLISKSIQDCDNFYEITKLNIDTSNDFAGGLDNLINNEEGVKCIIEFTPKFYFNKHELHLNFVHLDYKLVLTTLEIFNIEDKKLKKPLLTINNSIITVDCYSLFKQYQTFFYRYNVCEEYSLINGDRTFTKDYKTKFINKGNQKNMTEWYKFHSGGILLKSLGSVLHTGDLVFNGFNADNKNIGEYFILNEKFLELDYSNKGIRQLVDSIENKDSLEDYVQFKKSQNKDYNLIKDLSKIQKVIYSNYIVETKSLKFEDLGNSDMEYINVIDEFTNSDDLNYSLEEITKLLINNSTAYNLTMGSLLIYQDSIVEIFNLLKRTSFHSNVKNLTKRSYSIFEEDNNFSVFLKLWKILGPTRKKETLDFLKKQINKLGIADNIKIEITDTTGFIYLVKNGVQYPIIEEGSGAAKLVSLLLFLIKNGIYDFHLNNSESTKSNSFIKLLFIEEPESNLHPDLQSKMADILIDFINQYNVGLIIETHSEYFIRKLQYLISTKKVVNDKISLNYFERKMKNKKSTIIISEIPISKEGVLEKEFGSGFLDEANNLSIDLFLLNLSQKN